jgi:hypothetical protein
MSLVSSRKTYDTDSIVLRRIFAYDISNSPFSTGFVLTALRRGVATFLDLNLALSTIGVHNLPAELSTLEGELVSTFGVFNSNLPSSPTFFLPSTVQGLGSSGYISTFQLFSTVEGLGSAGYLSSFIIGDLVYSSIQGLGSVGYVSTASLTSTVEGLGTSGFISSSQLFSTVGGLGSAGYISSFQLFSTVQSLGTEGYISSFQLFSTVEGLGSAGYISTPQLTSTIDGLGSLGYLSTFRENIRSTYSNLYVGNWSNTGFLYSNLRPLSTVQTFQFDMGDAVRHLIDLSNTNLDIEFKANLQFGYFDSRSIQYDFSTCLVKGVSLNTSNIIAQENISYYILNPSPVNLPFFFTEKYRFLLNDLSTISSIKQDIEFSSLSLFHRVGISSPTTNQLFVFPAKPTSISLVLDNYCTTTP